MSIWKNKLCWVVLLVGGFIFNGCATSGEKAALVNPKTGERAVCPDSFSDTKTMPAEIGIQHVIWHAEFKKTHNRAPTVMEGCLDLFQRLGFQRAD